MHKEKKEKRKKPVAKGRPLKKLTRGVKKTVGRNHHGRITVRHRGGGNKRLYRSVDFKYYKKDIPARVEQIEYDPFRTAFIARIVYNDGERRYIVAPDGLKDGSEIIISENAPLVVGNRIPLKNIPSGTMVHNIELVPGKGGQLGRSAGTSIQVLANEGGYTHLKMPSGEIRKVLWKGWASLGQVSNPRHNRIEKGKAGRNRWLRRRPVVRGSAMNPVDHPYGGGEGRTQRGTKRPKDIWGNITGGKKTRNKNKPSEKLIIQRRKPKRRK